ncbi:hypothetical protein [Helicobacter sp. 23-1045]
MQKRAEATRENIWQRKFRFCEIVLRFCDSQNLIKKRRISQNFRRISATNPQNLDKKAKFSQNLIIKNAESRVFKA